MTSNSRFLFRALITSYAVIGYGIPIACTLYHSTFKQKYIKTRQSFKTSPKCFVFPFYFSRNRLETELRSKLESTQGQFIFIYGKPFIGKSTLIRKISSEIQDGILKINSYSFESFHKTLSKRIGFTFNDQYSWRNLLKNIHFPLSLCVKPKGSPQEQLDRTLNHLSIFCQKHQLITNRPWILTIDDADNLTKSQFIQIYKKLKPLITNNSLKIVIISSDPAFAAFVSDRNKFKDIKRLQMDEMNEYESKEFLTSQPCQLFVNRMRKYHGLSPNMNENDIISCYKMAGGIPLWLIQCAVKSPNKWYKQRIKSVKKIINQQDNSENIYKMQKYMINNNKLSLSFKEFIDKSQGIDNTIKLLHGIPRSSRHNAIFFHDLNRNNVSIMYQYLKQSAIIENNNNINNNNIKQ